MKSFLSVYGILFLVLAGCNPSSYENDFIPPEPKDRIIDGSVKVPVYDFDGLAPYLNRKNDTLYVVNFWASWCKPCVEEMPYFLAAEKKYSEAPFRLYLVSLDFKSDALNELIPFMRKNGLDKQVMLLSDPDANAWISKVNSQWSGAIPATLFYRDGKRYFHEGTLNEKELEEIINQFI